MINCIIFDLSEVFIPGLIGVEHTLAKRLGLDAAAVLPHLGGDTFSRVLCGTCSEADYLSAIRVATGWDIADEEFGQLIRQNFHQQVEGMSELLERLAARYELILLSDHGREWALYIESIHPFLQRFSRRIFSFELGQTKADAATFLQVLKMISKKAEECLFIDDNASNVARAGEVGIVGITFKGACDLEKHLKARGLL